MKQKYRDIHRYADGGKVVSTESSSDKPKPPPAPPAPKPDTIQAPKPAASLGETMRTQREKQMKELGLADGGKPKLGSGARFAALAAKTSPAIAAAAGRKKYGAKKMAAMAAAGRRKK